jgi:hypothetical protein
VGLVGYDKHIESEKNHPNGPHTSGFKSVLISFDKSINKLNI